MKICSSKKTKHAETVGLHLRIMGSAGSITSGKDIDDDDEFGKEIESGVTKKIPIECAPSRTKSTSVKSVGSFAVGKKKSRRSSKDKPVTKSTSLRSALSFDQEGGKSEGEPEQIRAFRTVYDAKVITSKTEIAALEVIKEKLHSENQRLRSEVKALTSTCTKLRNERAMALEAKEQAFQRAAAFEKGELNTVHNNIIGSTCSFFFRFVNSDYLTNDILIMGVYTNYSELRFIFSRLKFELAMCLFI